MEEPGQKMKKLGRETLIKVKYQIVDLLDKKKEFKEMLLQCEEYCLLLMEDLNYRELEDTYFWLYKHQGLSKEERCEYCVRIFEIDNTYNT